MHRFASIIFFFLMLPVLLLFQTCTKDAPCYTEGTRFRIQVQGDRVTGATTEYLRPKCFVLDTFEWHNTEDHAVYMMGIHKRRSGEMHLELTHENGRKVFSQTLPNRSNKDTLTGVVYTFEPGMLYGTVQLINFKGRAGFSFRPAN